MSKAAGPGARRVKWEGGVARGWGWGQVCWSTQERCAARDDMPLLLGPLTSSDTFLGPYTLLFGQDWFVPCVFSM